MHGGTYIGADYGPFRNEVAVLSWTAALSWCTYGVLRDTPCEDDQAPFPPNDLQRLSGHRDHSTIAAPAGIASQASLDSWVMTG